MKEKNALASCSHAKDLTQGLAWESVFYSQKPTTLFLMWTKGQLLRIHIDIAYSGI